MNIWEGFLWGVAGGVLVELLAWYKDRRNPTAAYPWRKYWVLTILMILAGGLLVVMYLRSGAGLNTIVCVNIGASAPLLIASLASAIPRVTPGKVD